MKAQLEIIEKSIKTIFEQLKIIEDESGYSDPEQLFFYEMYNHASNPVEKRIEIALNSVEKMANYSILAKSGIAKLTKEEREALGLSKYENL